MGGFLIPMAFSAPWVADPMSAAKGAFVVFTGFYVVCAAVTWFVYLRRPAEVRATSLARSRHLVTKTHCPYCSLQCGMTLERTGRALEVTPWPEFPVNEGALCRKGWTATGLRGHRERLTTPLVRDRATGELRAADWDEALDLVAGAAPAGCGRRTAPTPSRCSAAAG